MIAHAVVPDAHGRLRIVAVDVPEEDAEQHLRNSLFILRTLEVQHPAVAHFAPEIARAERRATAALSLIATPHLAVAHVRQAVAALTESGVDWNVVPDVRAAAARLLHCLYLLENA